MWGWREGRQGRRNYRSAWIWKDLCLRGHLPPMADYQELWRDLGHEKTPSTITLYGRDISNKIPISWGGRVERDGKKRIFSLSLSLFGKLPAM